MFLVAFVVLIIKFYALAKSFQNDKLHEYMNEPELALIFNAEDKKNVPEYEIVYLPILRVREAVGENEEEAQVDYEFSAFDLSILLNLKPNRNLAPRNFKNYVWYNPSRPTIVDFPIENCHYIHKNESSVAAITICKPDSIRGLIFLQNSSFEIHPIPKRLHYFFKRREALSGEDAAESFSFPHIIRRTTVGADFLENEAFPISRNFWNTSTINFEAASHRPVGAMTAEIALFFDEAGYNAFAPYMNYDDRKLTDMLLAYINGIQALYHHPSLGNSLELALVRLDIMKKQPNLMPHFNGERSKLLDSFCEYQMDLNPDEDSDPDHWDMALYVSGLDFFAYENGKKSGVTMGLAAVGGVCLKKYNCVIAELGTTNVYGKPYPSTGFTSVYILAHEIGHNLGMHHDSSGNNCPKEGYIMSPSRGTNGETQWSSCSADVMSKLSTRAKCLLDTAKTTSKMDHSKFLDAPGQTYTAKKQCEILLRDKQAVVLPSQKPHTICQNLQCKTPQRSGYYNAGPALEGTTCGQKKYCFGGECTKRALPKPVQKVPGGWSSWIKGKCTSGCIEQSLGHQTKQRSCSNPEPVNTDLGCEGPSYSVAWCTDYDICGTNRSTATSYASQKCKEFSELLPELDSEGVGLQAPHEESRLWMGCAIFCKRSDSESFFTPKFELNDLGVSPYFPDGTLCHRSDTMNYYCLQHHCLPANFEFTLRGSQFSHEFREDIPIPQNANPLFGGVPPELRDYFSLDSNGKPLQNVLKPSQLQPHKEEEWETKDYVEIPSFAVKTVFDNKEEARFNYFDEFY